MRLTQTTTKIRNTHSGILAGILFLSGLALPAEAGSINYHLPCPPPIPSTATIDSCVGSSPPAGGVIDLNSTVTSAGGVVTESIQGSMSFSLIPGSDIVNLYTRQTIAPGPGAVSFGNQYTVYVWADQPLSGPLTWVNTLSCSFFVPAAGDCQSAAAPILTVPYLGANPDLANAAQMSGFIGDGAFRPPGVTLPPGDWENLLTFQLEGGTMPNHIQFLVSMDATFQNGVIVPEPSTQGEVGIAIGIIFLIAYRGRKTSTWAGNTASLVSVQENATSENAKNRRRRIPSKSARQFPALERR